MFFFVQDLKKYIQDADIVYISLAVIPPAASGNKWVK